MCIFVCVCLYLCLLTLLYNFSYLFYFIFYFGGIDLCVFMALVLSASPINHPSLIKSFHLYS